MAAVQVRRRHARRASPCRRRLRRLDHDREADLLGRGHQCLIVQPAFAARHQRHATLAHRLARRDLVAHRLDGLGAGADKGDAGIGARGGKFGMFGEKAIARMDGIHAGLAGDIDNLVDAQIALAAGCRADAIGLVGVAHMQRGAVGFGKDRNRVDAALLAGTQHTDSNLTSVGNQHFLEHGRSFSSQVAAVGCTITDDSDRVAVNTCGHNDTIIAIRRRRQFDRFMPLAKQRIARRQAPDGENARS